MKVLIYIIINIIQLDNPKQPLTKLINTRLDNHQRPLHDWKSQNDHWRIGFPKLTRFINPNLSTHDRITHNNQHWVRNPKTTYIALENTGRISQNWVGQYGYHMVDFRKHGWIIQTTKARCITQNYDRRVG